MLDGSNRDDPKRAPPTIRDVAAAAGVSIATVSAVLNGKVRVSPQRSELVRKAIADLGYAPNGPARSLRSGRSKVIGIVVGNVANPFFTSVIRIIEQRASEAGYFVMVANSDDDVDRELELLRLFREQRVAGIVLAPAASDDDYVAALRDAIDVPAVLVDRQLPDMPFDTVVVDNRKAARSVTQYLLRLGHKRIGIVLADPQFWTTQERLAGYREAMAEAGHSPDPALQCLTVPREAEAYQAVQRLLTGPKPPTAIFAANNVTMLATVESVFDIGYRCPDDISIAGIDELPWASAIRPKLTTVCQPVEDIGKETMRLLLGRLDRSVESSTEPRRVMLEPRLFIQNSCARITDKTAELAATGAQESRINALQA